MPTMTEYIRHTMRLDLNRLSPDPAWPTKRQDLQAAVAILQRHAAAGEPLRLLDAYFTHGGRPVHAKPAACFRRCRPGRSRKAAIPSERSDAGPIVLLLR